MPFKTNAARRHRIPKQQHRVTNWAEYDAALRQRGSLTVWFSQEAIAAWWAEPRTTPGGQPHYSALAIRTALTLRAVFRLALRQTEGLIRSILELLSLDLTVPDHSTLCRRAETLEVPRSCLSSGGPVHLLVDSTGLRLCGPGEWLIERHGTTRRRSWRKLHIGVDAETRQILASELTTNDVDDGSQVGPLLNQITDPLASFIGDGAYDQTCIYDTIAKRDPDAEVIIPPRSTAVPSDTAESAPTQRDRHLQSMAEHGRMGWQRRSRYTRRALVEAAISRLKRVIGNALRSRTEHRRATEVAIAVHALNRMLELGRPKSFRIARNRFSGAFDVCTIGSVQQGHAAPFSAVGSHLERYGAILNAVEINSSFYRPHRRATYERWATLVPDDFRFAVKVPKTITHERQLKDASDLLDRFVSEVSGLGHKLSPLLVQLPPSLSFQAGIADQFLRELRGRTEGGIVCEPRHASWFTPGVESLLNKLRIARVAADPPPASGADEPGGWCDLTYYRLHGSPRIHYSAHSPEYLTAIATVIARDAAAAVETWCIFDDTAAFAATGDALTTRRLVQAR